MMSGGSPAQLVRMITWTSEISGRASSGTRCKDQMPANVNIETIANTRKRFREHISMIRAIISHSAFCIQAELLCGDKLSVLSGRNGHLPRTAHRQHGITLVESCAPFAESR